MREMRESDAHAFWPCIGRQYAFRDRVDACAAGLEHGTHQLALLQFDQAVDVPSAGQMLGLKHGTTCEGWNYGGWMAAIGDARRYAEQGKAASMLGDVLKTTFGKEATLENLVDPCATHTRSASSAPSETLSLWCLLVGAGSFWSTTRRSGPTRRSSSGRSCSEGVTV